MIIREATVDDVQAIAEVHVAAWRTAYRGIMPDQFLGQLSIADRRKRWEEILTKNVQDEFTFVAALDGKIVGFANGGPERKNEHQFAAELYAIYLLDEFRGRGIGTALLNKSVKRFIGLGLQSMMVWVLKDNPYRRFYERHGGVPIQEAKIQIAEVELGEVAYGWTNLRQ